MYVSKIGSLGMAMDNAGPEKQSFFLLSSVEMADISCFTGWC